MAVLRLYKVDSSDSVESSPQPKSRGRYVICAACIGLVVCVETILGPFTMMQNQFLVAVDPARQTAKNQSGNLMKNKINHEYSSVELWSPRNMTGTWIGNTCTSESVEAILGGRYRILWIGDSTSRRASMTLFEVLNTTSTDPSLFQLEKSIDVNRKSITENCTRWSNSNGNETAVDYSFFEQIIPVCRRVNPVGGVTVLNTACLTNLKEILLEETGKGGVVAPDFDLIVISLGIWDQMRPRICKMRPGMIPSVIQDIAALARDLVTIHPHLKVIWRTSGWQARIPIDQQRTVQIVNEAIMDSFDNATFKDKVSFVDWGGAVAPRSVEERIHGDIPAHYGQGPRLALIQMIANRLQEMEKTAPRGKKRL